MARPGADCQPVEEARATDPHLLRFTTQGAFWDTLASAGITLLITREYEHLIIALRSTDAGPAISFMRMPHPSGLVVDRERNIVHIASTRNPNQVYDLMPVRGLMPRLDADPVPVEDHPLVPVRSRYLAGCTYLHDLAIIDGTLYGNSVGQNAVVRIDEGGYAAPVWWPRCIETKPGPASVRTICNSTLSPQASISTHLFSLASPERFSAAAPDIKTSPLTNAA